MSADGDLWIYLERQQWTGARIYRGWGSDRLDNRHMTVGEAAVRIFVWVFDLVKRIVCFWISILISPFVWIGRRFCRLIRKIEKRLCINLKKVMQKEKYNLKRKLDDVV